MILAGDIGATKALLRLAAPSGRGAAVEARFASRDYPDFDSLLRAFLELVTARRGARIAIERACFGVAGPVAEGRSKLTYLPWRIDAGAVARRFRIGEVRLLNDLAAAAHGIAVLRRGNLATLQAGRPLNAAPRVVIGAGSGLGVAYIVPGPGQDLVVAGEGGHAAFAPRDDLQMELWRHLRKTLGQVSVEHIVSGPGLERIYRFLRMRGRRRAEPDDALSAAEIAERARAGRSALAAGALDLFISAYAGAAAGHALAVLARGGVFLVGGIAPAILWRLRQGGFVRAFNNCDVPQRLVRAMPVYVVREERVALLGAMRLAARS